MTRSIQAGRTLAVFLIAFASAPHVHAEEQNASLAAAVGEPSAAEARAPDASEPATARQDNPGTATQLLVHLSLENTHLTADQVLAALQEEFEIPVTASDQSDGLSIAVDDRNLTISYTEETKDPISRTAVLPRDPARQLDMIALFAGNLARDEAALLLEELKAKYAAEKASEAPPPPLPPAQDETEKRDTETPAQALVAAKQTKSDAAARPEDNLEETPFSASVTGKVVYPKKLKEMRTHAELGLFYSDIGALNGAAITLIASRVRGLSQSRPGQGAQMSLAWARNDGAFDGALLTMGASALSGDLNGAQASLLVSMHRGNTEGAQLAGLVSLTEGNTTGAQSAAIAALNAGQVRGAQLAVIFAHASSVQGAQIAMIPTVGKLEGAQLGLVPIAYQEQLGVQVGLINIAGRFSGTQVGLVNIGDRGKGTQVGMINVAARNEGTSLGFVNVVPGQRTQLVSYASYTTKGDLAGLPLGVLGHVGVKYTPGPLYTQLSIGFGPDTEDCGGSRGSSQCTGNGVVYAPGFALGVRANWGSILFAEMDLTYQFAKAIDQTSPYQHAILGRAALGAQLSRKVALIIGGGPRVNLVEDPGKLNGLAVSFAPHAYAGLQLF